jgi:hypothetical protein
MTCRTDDVILTTLPLFHVGGLNNQTTPALKRRLHGGAAPQVRYRC